MITGDRDLFQLVDDARGVRVLSVVKGVRNHERVTDEWLEAKYGINGAGYADFATLRGDASDGLPGVAGVGEKTAARLIADYGDLEECSPPRPRRSSPRPDGQADRRHRLPGSRPGGGAGAPRPRPGVSFDDLVLPTEPAQPEVFAELTELLNLGGSAERILKALALNR